MKRASSVGAWRDGRTTAQRGYGGRWQRHREAYLHRHPLCIQCEKDGRIELATVIDHIVPHRGDLSLFWDRKNWQPLCKPHHDAKTQQEVGAVVKRQIGLDGWPT